VLRRPTLCAEDPEELKHDVTIQVQGRVGHRETELAELHKQRRAGGWFITKRTRNIRKKETNRTVDLFM